LRLRDESLELPVTALPFPRNCLWACASQPLVSALRSKTASAVTP
jgi:hypothetical protein